MTCNKPILLLTYLFVIVIHLYLLDIIVNQIPCLILILHYSFIIVICSKSILFSTNFFVIIIYIYNDFLPGI